MMQLFLEGVIFPFMKETSLPTFEDFRLYLQNELVRRCQINPQYSLRAFARSLNVSSSALSAMLNGKRPITERTKNRLCLALDLSPEEIQKFSQKEKKNVTSYTQLTLDTFALISDWYYFAILELVKIDSFKSDASWVAQRLGITKSEVNIAIERLIRLEMIEVDSEGNWKDTSTGSTTSIEAGLTSVGARKLQQQVLEKAIKALQDVALAKRDNTSMTVAVNSKDIPAVKEKIKVFRRSLTEFLEREGNGIPDEVYHLGIAFYPITINSTGE